MNDQDRVVEWIQTNLGGHVVGVSPQPRWRYAWFVDLVRDGETLPLYVRSERPKGAFGPYPLPYEYRVQQVMEHNGIPVPHVYGFCEDPPAIVMANVAGDTDLRKLDPDVRDRVVEEYIVSLARLHRLDIAEFAAVGVAVPTTAEEVGLAAFIRFEDEYLRTKVRPDPFLEFTRRWAHRNVPQHRTAACMIIWDAGQMLHHDGHLSALFDLETAHIGDPMMDLAAMRMRDTTVGLGNFAHILRRYEDAVGAPVDRDVVDFHTILFSLTNQLGTHAALATPNADSDLMTYICWCTETNLWALELMAQRLGVDLEPMETPPASPGVHGAAHQQLVTVLGSLHCDDPFLRYQLRSAFRLARHLARTDELGAMFAEELDDVAQLLGRRFERWQDADAALEVFVTDAGPEHDAALVRLFHRRMERQRISLGPESARVVQHAALQPLD